LSIEFATGDTLKKAFIIFLVVIGLLFVILSVANYFSLNKAIVDNDVARVKLLLRFGADLNRQSRLTFGRPFTTLSPMGIGK